MNCIRPVNTSLGYFERFKFCGLHYNELKMNDLVHCQLNHNSQLTGDEIRRLWVLWPNLFESQNRKESYLHLTNHLRKRCKYLYPVQDQLETLGAFKTLECVYSKPYIYPRKFEAIRKGNQRPVGCKDAFLILGNHTNIGGTKIACPYYSVKTFNVAKSRSQFKKKCKKNS